MNYLSMSYNNKKNECIVNCDSESINRYDIARNFKPAFWNIASDANLNYALNLIQVDLIASETVGTCWQPGNPSKKYGHHLWIQFSCKDGTKTPFIYYHMDAMTRNTIENALFWALVKIADDPIIQTEFFYKNFINNHKHPLRHRIPKRAK